MTLKAHERSEDAESRPAAATGAHMRNAFVSPRSVAEPPPPFSKAVTCNIITSRPNRGPSRRRFIYLRRAADAGYATAYFRQVEHGRGQLSAAQRLARAGFRGQGEYYNPT